MKKLLLLLSLVFSLSLTSCFEDVNKSVSNPAKATTTYLQNLPKDTTVTVAYERHSIYIFSKKDNILLYKGDSNEEASLPINFILLLVICGFCFLLGGLLISDF